MLLLHCWAWYYFVIDCRFHSWARSLSRSRSFLFQEPQSTLEKYKIYPSGRKPKLPVWFQLDFSPSCNHSVVISSTIESCHLILTVNQGEWQDPVLFRRPCANNSLEGVPPGFDIFVLKLITTRNFSICAEYFPLIIDKLSQSNYRLWNNWDSF